MKRWTVHAFEGTSCCSADGMAHILEVFRQHRNGPVCVVVSPKSDIPPALLSLVDQAIVREESLWGTMESLSQQMSGLADELVPPDYRQDLEAAIREDFRNIEDILRAVWLVRDSSPRTREYISGLGAVWVAQVFHSRLKAEGYSVKWLDTREVISVKAQEYGTEVQWNDTKRALDQAFDNNGQLDFLVVTGGLGRTVEGAATSLGKDGAELTATILANLLDAEQITLWKQVDGVMSADPQKVPGSEVIPE
ncbi:MAG: bifunctional aspartate kinase/homoserine dehydrogenase I, partial [Spirochaetota bacterium]